MKKKQDDNLPGEYVIYTIDIANITNDDIRTIIDRIAARGIPGSYQRITPAISGEPGRIQVPRLCTFWRGDDAEKDWSKDLRDVIKGVTESATIEITAVPWTPAPGHPR